MVRVTGFEPAASCSQSTRATNCATPGRSVFEHYTITIAYNQEKLYAIYREYSVIARNNTGARRRQSRIIRVGKIRLKQIRREIGVDLIHRYYYSALRKTNLLYI